MNQVIAKTMNGAEDSAVFSPSFHNLRQWPRQANVRSTVQRIGRNTQPFALPGRRMTSSTDAAVISSADRNLMESETM